MGGVTVRVVRAATARADQWEAAMDNRAGSLQRLALHKRILKRTALTVVGGLGIAALLGVAALALKTQGSPIPKAAPGGRLGAMPKCVAQPTAFIVPANGANTSSNAPNPAQVLSSDSISHLGAAARIVRPDQSLSTATPAGAIPITVNGSYAGKRNCDSALADSPEAAKLSISGARALAQAGFPAQPDGQPGPLEQRHVLDSPAFLPNLLYIEYVVPDPSSGHRNSFGGITYDKNLYAIAAIASDGSVKYSQILSS